MPSAAKTKHKIHGWAAALRRRFPTAFPVSVRLCQMDDRFGDADLTGDDDKRRFVIRIESRLTTALQIHFLVHEWAHCLRWDHRHDVGDADWDAHDGAWGVHYAEVYRYVFHGDQT